MPGLDARIGCPDCMPGRKDSTPVSTRPNASLNNAPPATAASRADPASTAHAVAATTTRGTPTAACDEGWFGRWRRRFSSAPPDHTDGGDGLVDRVLRARGVPHTDRDAWLAPALTELHDPSLMPGLEQAAERLLRAVRGGERVVIYGDYDVDGITATAILFHTLRHISPDADVATYVPHRLEEGYGLNEPAMRELADAGARVVVSVDCGVTAVGPAAAARHAGLDLIITDHHTPPQRPADLPDAHAIVHPALPGGGYPFPDLPGAGVAFKLAWRLTTLAHDAERVPPPTRALLLELLALASLGVIADVVPLVGENRVIARHGLGRVKHSAIPGLRALVEACSLAGEDIEAEDVGFKMGPRLNACGRLGHAREAVELLTTATGDRATDIARALSGQNDARRRLAERIEAEAIERAEDAGMTGPDRRAIVLASPDWHPGVVGIVCSRLVERFHRPAILLCTDDDGTHRGSGRSVEGYNLHRALGACAEPLETFGGHAMAAGLRVAAHGLDDFTRRLVAHANDAISPDDLVARLTFDCDASLAECTPGAAHDLDRLGPFGRDNPRPRLRVLDAQLAEPARRMGASGAHLCLQLKQHGRIVRCVAWKKGDVADRLPRGARVHALLTPKINRWNGRERVECEIADLTLADP